MKKIFLFLFLMSCGFRPLYNDAYQNIYISNIQGTNGIILRNKLLTRFLTNNNKSNSYRLDVYLNKPTTKYKAIQKQGNATWQDVTIVANYKLYKDNNLILSDKTTATDSYAFVEYLVASNTFFNNSIQNILNIRANDIYLKTSKHMLD